MWRLFAVCCFAPLASACVSLQQPPPAAASAIRISLLTATTRAPSSEPGEQFGTTHGSGVSIARQVVSAPVNRTVGAVVMTDREAESQEGVHFHVVSTRSPLGARDLADYVGAARRKRLASVMLVHGFNNTYRSGLYRVAQIVADLNMKEAPILFSFASAGRLLDYQQDRANAQKAAPELAKFIERVSTLSGGHFDIGAHSMGGWMTMLALRDIADRRRPGAPPLMRAMIFASPDIDVDEFEQNWPHIKSLARNTVLICHPGDIALRFSMRIAGLGHYRAGNIADCVNEAPKRFPGIRVVDAAADDSRMLDQLKHNPAANPALITRFAEELKQRRDD